MAWPLNNPANSVVQFAGMLWRVALHLVLCALCLLPAIARAAFDQNEPALTPSNISTADTLRKDEKFFAPQGWLSYGVTDRLTFTWDWFVAFGGIPAGYVRYQLPLGSQAVAVEVYAAEFRDSTRDERVNEFMVEHQHATSWARVNWSSPRLRDFRIHLYAGKSYYRYVRYASAAGAPFPEKLYEQDASLDYGGGLEWQVSPAVRAYLNYIYGNSFTLFDQIPHKTMAVLGLHFAPFDRSYSKALSRMRLELNAIAIDIPDAQYNKFFPVFPVLYWQW